MNAALARFRETWLARLNEGAETLLFHEANPVEGGLHTRIADDFVASHGYKPIGFNWELLDAAPGATGKRAAPSQLAEAFAGRIENPRQEWLSRPDAEACAEAFLALFDEPPLTLVSNRYDGLWNPISSAHDQWAFVGFDRGATALLLITAP
ncbi:hypothetical protein [Qipengyuania nanhaisediminis]|uniref:hypothetical protein n=1 Tax=Qipengyuania nanhaisediminis TaxID=604088 RepID=UPI0038B2C409